MSELGGVPNGKYSVRCVCVYVCVWVRVWCESGVWLGGDKPVPHNVLLLLLLPGFLPIFVFCLCCLAVVKFCLVLSSFCVAFLAFASLLSRRCPAVVSPPLHPSIIFNLIILIYFIIIFIFIFYFLFIFFISIV